MRKTIKLLSVSILAISVALGLAVATTDTTTFSITVTDSTAIDISPNSFSFSGAPGQGISGNNTAVIENIGSTNISQISVDVGGANDVSPIGSGISDNYNSGEFALVSVSNASNTFYFIQGNIYNETKPGYLNLHGEGKDASGRIRIGTSEYFWAVGNNTWGSCANGTLYISNTSTEIHNRTQMGGTDLSGKTGRALTNTSISNVSTATSFGLTDITLQTSNGVNLTYCFGIAADCSYGSIWKYNQAANPYDNVSACSSDTYFYNVADGLKPGAITPMYFSATIAQGVANGTLSQSTITVRATD